MAQIAVNAEVKADGGGRISSLDGESFEQEIISIAITTDNKKNTFLPL